MDANKLLAIACVSKILTESSPSSSSEESEEYENIKIAALGSVIQETQPSNIFACKIYT